MPTRLPDLSKQGAVNPGRRRLPDLNAPRPKPKAKERGGLLGTLSRIPGDVASDLYHAAVGIPAGLYYIGEGVSRDVADAASRTGLAPERSYAARAGRESRGLGRNTRDIGAAIVKGFEEDIRHPLRHPGYTALDILGVASLGAGTAARGAAAAGKLGRGGSIGEAARIAARGPKPGRRVLRVGNLEVTRPASRSALTRAVQRGTDKAVQARGGKTLHKRAGKWMEETGRVEEALAKAPAAALAAAGRKLSKEQKWALRLVAEEAPIDGRKAALRERIANSTGAERRRHAKRLQLTENAEKYLTSTTGKPELKPEATKLRSIYERMEHVAGSREQLGKELGLLTDEAIQGRKTAAGRVALGATYEKPTPGKLGVSDPLERARKRVTKLEGRYETALNQARKRAGQPENVRIPGSTRTRPRTVEEVEAKIAELEKGLNPKIEAVYKYLRSAEPTRAVGKDMRPRREYKGTQEYNLGRHGAGAGEYVDKDFKPLRHRTEEQAKRHDWERAEQQIYERGRKEGANPILVKLADQMDELDELRQLVLKNKEAPIFGEKAPGFGEVTEATKPAAAPSDIPPLGMFGPKVTRLGGALSVARDELERIERTVGNRRKRTGIIGQEAFRASPESVYIPDIEQRVGRTGRLNQLGAQGVIGEPPSPIRKGYTGGAKRTAREPLDTTRAVAEAQLAVSKFHRLVNLRGKLVKAATSEPRRRDDIAIRLDQIGRAERLPPDVRAFLDDPGSLAPDEAQGLFERLRKETLLAPENAEEFNRLSDEGKIGWVPKHLLGDLAKSQAPLKATLGKVPVEAVDSINNAQRLSILYLKPAYAIPNLLGNLALNLVQQGFAAPRHLSRAAKMQWQLGPENTAIVDTVMHEGFAAALRGEQGLLAGATQTAANVWGKGVDKPFRRAAFSYEAWRQGYRSPKQIEKLLTDPALHGDLVDVSVRANREIIDYGRMSHREREIVRRIVFFYPWVKGSTFYAGNFLMEHPIKAAAAGAIGQEGIEETEERLGFQPPSFLEGVAITPGGRLVNPRAAAILQTPSQVAGAAAALATGRTPEVAEISEFATPALSLGLNLAAGKNLRTGYEYPRGERGLKDVGVDTLFKSTPQYRLYEQLTGRSKAKLFPPSPRSGLEQFLVGGVAPRDFNRSRLRALARREQKELRR